MRAKSILFFGFLAFSTLTSAAWSQPVVTGGGPGKQFAVFFSTAGGGFPPPLPVIIPPLMMGLQAAHVTSDQQSKIDQIMQNNRAQTAPLIQQLEGIHEQIANKLLSSGMVTSSDLAPLENQASQLDAQIQQQSLDASVQIRSLLTNDQVSRMAQFHDKMAALQAQMKALMNEATETSSAGASQ
jgi:hypothetical protein